MHHILHLTCTKTTDKGKLFHTIVTHVCFWGRIGCVQCSLICQSHDTYLIKPRTKCYVYPLGTLFMSSTTLTNNWASFTSWNTRIWVLESQLPRLLLLCNPFLLNEFNNAYVWMRTAKKDRINLSKFSDKKTPSAKQTGLIRLPSIQDKWLKMYAWECGLTPSNLHVKWG